MTQIGRIMLVIGITIALLGVVIWAIGRLGAPLPRRLPGDFLWDTGRVRVWVPIGTMIALSVALTLLINIILWIMRWFGR